MKSDYGKEFYRHRNPAGAGKAAYKKAEKVTGLRRSKTVKTASVIKVVKRKRRG